MCKFAVLEAVAELHGSQHGVQKSLSLETFLVLCIFGAAWAFGELFAFFIFGLLRLVLTIQMFQVLCM